jgi:hypothetical protein
LEQGQQFRKARMEAIEAGLIRRALFVAERPPSRRPR